MKKLIHALFISLFLAFAAPAYASPFDICLSGCDDIVLKLDAPLKADGEPVAVTEAKLAPTLYLAPSIGFDAFVRDNSDNTWKAGVIPGVGYGIKFRPSYWTITENMVSLDVFTQAMFMEDTFNIDVLPVVTLFDWVGVGFGYRFKLATASGADDGGGTLFSIGIRKSVASF